MVAGRGFEPRKTHGLNVVAVPICICQPAIKWHGRQESNPHKALLESAALPHVPRPYEKLVRKTGIEPATSSLATKRTTTVLLTREIGDHVSQTLFRA